MSLDPPDLSNDEKDFIERIRDEASQVKECFARFSFHAIASRPKNRIIAITRSHLRNRRYPMKSTANSKRVVMFALVVTVSAAIVGLIASGTPVGAAAFTVTNLNDSGPGSLRQAILDANASPGGDTIGIVAGLSGAITLTSGQLTISDDLTLTGPGESVLAVSGNNASRVFEIALGVNVTISDLTIRDGMVSGISGGGIRTRGRLNLDRCTLSNNSAFQGGAIFNESLTLTITNVTISGNTASHAGGGICNDTGFTAITSSTLTSNHAQLGGGFANVFSIAAITNSTISDNSANSDGGGILNDGAQLTVTGTTISGNTAKGLFGRGGGIDNHLASSLTITESTISNNTARDGGGISSSNFSELTITSSTISVNSGSQGGGILNSDRSTLTVTNSAISGNSASPFQGGGIRTSGSAVSISSSTITGNSAPPNQFGSAGGIYNVTNVVTVKNSIVANNANGDCFTTTIGSIVGLGINFSTDGSCPGFTQVTPAQLNLGPLGNNGGTTQTHALLTGSVAIDTVTDCTDVAGNRVTKDQRGVMRPIDGNCDGIAQCDVGGYEAPLCTTSTFNVCLQDDSNASILFLGNAQTGAYLFCCGGTMLTGIAQVTLRGSTATFQHYSTDRRVLARADGGVFRGSAALQSPPGTTICTITERDTRNNSCVCQ